ncbi:hypothetical protein QAD02_011817 [Eretmocerus hayati]|uniref:Uncharacterized protein n=1 Tax=Eretmocerus hayati TaxID=131215 RepID=A0ACC2NZL6_9HYME|nr:hypothetical protein QAD02_011817 [Eretmocerus hayati]
MHTDIQDIEFVPGALCMTLEFDEDSDMKLDIRTLNRYFTNVEELEFVRPGNPTVKTVNFDSGGFAILRKGISKYSVVSSKSEIVLKEKELLFKQGPPNGGDKLLELDENEDYSYEEIKSKLIDLFLIVRTRGYFENAFIEVDSNSDFIICTKRLYGDKPKGFWGFYKKVMGEKKNRLEIQDKLVQRLRRSASCKNSQEARVETVFHQEITKILPQSHESPTVSKPKIPLTPKPVPNSADNAVSDKNVKMKTHAREESSKVMEPLIDLSNSNISDQNVSPNKLDCGVSPDKIDLLMNLGSYDDRVRKACNSDKLISFQAELTKPKQVLQNNDRALKER